MTTTQAPLEGVRGNLLALGFPTDIVSRDCRIKAEDSHGKVQTFVDVKVIACYLQAKNGLEELVLSIKPQIHMGGTFNILKRNVERGARKTGWWTDVCYHTKGSSTRMRTESWKILELSFE